MTAFEYAWAILKANPYEQAYIEQLDHEWPRGFGEGPAVYHQPMGKIHDAILGLMRRNDPSGGLMMDHRIRVPGERRKGLIEDIPTRHLLAEPIYDYDDWKRSYKGSLGDDYRIWPQWDEEANELVGDKDWDHERAAYRAALEDEGLQPHPVPRAVSIYPKRDEGWGHSDDWLRHDFDPAVYDEEGNFYMNEPPAITSIYPREI